MTEKSKRSKALLLSEEEAAIFIDLIKRNKIKNTEIAHMLGKSCPNVVSPWMSSGRIPACCRAYLKYLQLKEMLKKSLN